MAQQGTQLTISQPNGTMNEKWKVSPSRGGYMLQASSNPKLCLDINE